MTATVETRCLYDLVPVLEREVNRHLDQAKDWMPHRLAVGDSGDGAATVRPEVRAALVLNLLTEDNLPSYHREVGDAFSSTKSGYELWSTWLDIWTAEESRHALAIRDYLIHSGRCTGWFDSDDYERRRMRMLRGGWHPNRKSPLRFLAYVSVQELATRISHRRTGQLSGDPTLDKLLAQVAADENLHMILYRDLVSAALDLDPVSTLLGIEAEVVDFQMPGTREEHFRTTARQMALLGIYNLRVHHDEVLLPLMRSWRLADREQPAPADEIRTRIAIAMAMLDNAAHKQQDRIEHTSRQQQVSR